VESEHLSLLRERLDLINQRRRADDEDDLCALYGPLPVTAPSEATEEETDEWGRAIPKPSSTSLRNERRAARKARHQQHLSRVSKPRPEDEEGYSTDSSLAPPDASDYASANQSLLLRIKGILSDVRAEEFRNPTGEKWNQWRERYGDTYRNAWGGLGVVSAWEFWVRLEIAGWNCIEVRYEVSVKLEHALMALPLQEVRSLDSFNWYKSLYEYSRPDTGNGAAHEERELGPDGDLVASMISTAIIPKVCKLIESGMLDVYSERHIKRIVDFAEEIEATMEEGNTKFQVFSCSIRIEVLVDGVW